MSTGGCHCGTVRFALSRGPETVTKCNCSICSKLGTLWAYYPHEDFQLTAGEAQLTAYSWGSRHLAFRFCRACGCMVNWQAQPDPLGGHKVGVNARLIDHVDLEALPVLVFNGRDER